jgi:hypothetical protein
MQRLYDGLACMLCTTVQAKFMRGSRHIVCLCKEPTVTCVTPMLNSGWPKMERNHL